MAFSEAERRDRQGRLFTCGYLIHNKEVVRRLESMGVTMIDSLDEANEGDTVIVRSHGEPREFYDKAAERGIELIDRKSTRLNSSHL